MAEISPYRLPPQGGYSQATGQYDPVAFMQSQAQQYNAGLPAIPDVPPVGPLNVPSAADTGQGQQGQSEWARLLAQASKADMFTPEAFDALADEFKRARIAPFAALRGMSEQQRDAFLGGFDAQAAKDKAALFPQLAQQQAEAAATAEQQARQNVGFGRDVYNLGKAALNTVGSGVSNTVGMVGGGLLEIGRWLTPEGTSPDRALEAAQDYVFRTLVDPDRRTENFLGGKTAEQLASESISSDIPKDSERYKRLYQLQLGNFRNLIAENAGTSLSGAFQREREEASAESPISAGIGTGLGIIAEALLTRRAPGFSQIIEGSRGAGLGRRVLSELPTGSLIGQQMAGEAAVSNVNRGDEIENVLAQYGLDTAFGTALAALPPSLRGGLLTRATSGAGLGVAQTEVQQALAAAVNPANTYDPLSSVTTPEGIANAVVGAGLGAFGGARPATRQPSQNRNQPGTQPPQQGAPNAPQATPGQPATGAGNAATTPAASPWDGPAATPLADDALQAQQTRLDGKLSTRRPLYKKRVPGIETADDLVTAAVDETRSLLGDTQWGRLNNAQRMGMVERTLDAMRKHSKIEAVPEAAIVLRTQVLSQPQPTVTRTPAQRLAELQAKRDGTPDTTATDAEGKTRTVKGKPKEILTDAEKAELASLEATADLGTEVVNPAEALGVQPRPTAADLGTDIVNPAEALNVRPRPQFDPQEYIGRSDPLTDSEKAALESLNTPTSQIDASTVAPQVGRTVLHQTGRVPNDARSPRPAAAPKRRTGKKTEKAAQQKDTTPTVTRESRPNKSPTQQDRDYYRSLFNYAAGNPVGMFGNITVEQVARDPGLDIIRQGIREGAVTDVDTMRGYLENRGLQDDAQTPQSKGEHDNRLISKLVNSGKKAEAPAKAEARRLRDRGKQLGLKANEIKNMTLAALRSTVDDLETQLGNKAPPKETPKRRTGKKAEKAKVETKPEDTTPKRTPQKEPSDLKLHELEAALNEQGSGKTLTKRTTEIRKLKRQADQLESEILGLQKVRHDAGKKGGRTRADLRDMTVAQLEKYRNELRSDNVDLLAKRDAEEKAKQDRLKKAEEKQKSIKINRAHNDGMGDIADLGNQGTEGAIAPISKEAVTRIQKVFANAVADGKTSALRSALIEADVYGTKIDDIVKAAKNAHTAELARVKDAVDAEGKPLPKSAKSKILKGFLDYKAGELSKTKFRELVWGLTRDETGNGIESRLFDLAEQEKSQLQSKLKELATEAKKNVEEAPRPKAQAPRKGAAKQQSARSRKLSPKTKTLSEKLSEVVATDDLSAQQRGELELAIKTAQEGDNTVLYRQLTDLVDAEYVTPEQARAIRALGQEEAQKPLQPTKNAIDELLKGQDENIDGDLDPVQQAAVGHRSRLNNDYSDISLLDDSPDGKLNRSIEEVWEKVDAGKMTPQDAQKQLAMLKRDHDAQQARQKLAKKNDLTAMGPEELVSRLRKIKFANTNRPKVQRLVDFAIWAIEQNPNVANRVRLLLSDELTTNASGKFLVTKEGGGEVHNVVLNANLDKVNPTTAVHEVMHASERLMPKDLQDRIRGEYTGRLLNKLKQVQRNGRLAEIDYLKDVVAYLTAPSKETYAKAISHILQGKVNKQEFYKYLNPSEYWAEEATRILARRHRSENSWLPRLREWTAEYIERIKNVFGWDNNSAIYKGLNEILSSDGQLAPQARMLKEGLSADELPTLDITEVDPATQKTLDDNNIEVTKAESEDTLYMQTDGEAKAQTEQMRSQLAGWQNLPWYQRAWENLAYAGFPLEQAKVALAEKGIHLPFDVDPAEQLRLKDGKTSRNNDIDNNEVVRPVDNFLEENWGKYADDKAEFVGKLNDFFGLTNLKERAHTAWLLNVKLAEGKGWTRDTIIEDVRTGDITPEQGRAKLETLVKRYADSTEQEYIETYIPDFDEYEARLKTLDDDGINTNSMQELNKLLDDVRTRQRERLVESGQVDENDVWTGFYGWKWYVPLKGTSAENASPQAQNSFDIIPPDKLALAKLNQQYKAMEGRGTEGERPFERLFVDLARSGERAAHGGFMRSLYELVATHQKEFGAYVHALEGNPHDGYTDNKGNTYAKLPTPRDGQGFIFNDGTHHYVVTLNAASKSGNNAASQLLRGLITSNDILRPSGGLKKVAKVTNTLARNYTTMSPTWQLYKGFVRDLTTIPLTMSVENFSGPVAAAKFNAAFAKEIVTSFDSVQVLAKQMSRFMQDGGVYDSITKLAADKPDSWAGWTKRYLDNGGSNMFTQGFELDSVRRGFSKSARNRADIAANTANSASQRAAAAAGVALTPYTKWGEMTSNWAQFLELVPRVAAFKAYKQTVGGTDAEAAIATRRVMDYQQSGRWGRNINSLLAFYRTGVTGADVLRRSLRTKDGKFDAVKAGKWATVMPVFSFLTYQAWSAMMGQDENGIDNVRKLRPSTLTTYMVLPFTDSEGRPYGMSLGLGWPQLMFAPGVLAAAVEAGHITEQEAIDEMTDVLRRNATPMNKEMIASSLTATQPFVDLDRNRDNFDRPIHTEHPDRKKPAWQQGRQNTAPLYKDIAKFIYNATDTGTAGVAPVDYYPEDIRYLMSSYGGSMVTDFLKKVVDAPTLAEGGIENTTNPLTSRAVIRDAEYYDIERIYRLTAQYERLERRINNVTGGDTASREQYLKENPAMAEVIAAAKALRSERGRRDKAVKALRTDNNSLGRRAALRKQYDSSLREATTRLEKALERI